MTSKEYLLQPNTIKKKLHYLELDLERFKVMMNSVSHPCYDSVRVDKSRSSESPNQVGLNKYNETLNKIRDKELELEDVQNDIANTIEQIENLDEREVLKLHYINNVTITDIADRLYVCIRTVQRWHKSGLESLEMILNKKMS